ncbi:MAG: hypothetical protein J3R72DRAFT_431721 [Linnemannia gamsii]|nr:MAG: hypothetical protein J3R72DRAFT_431721 [Linnemannia gamsii]
MKYLAAYLLLTIGGNTAPAAKDITALLATVGIEAESERIETLIAQLAGKDINEVKKKKTSTYIHLSRALGYKRQTFQGFRKRSSFRQFYVEVRIIMEVILWIALYWNTPAALWLIPFEDTLHPSLKPQGPFQHC